MMLRSIAISASLLLITSLASGGEPSICVKVSRFLGYGINDGYHAQRYCLPVGKSCDSCSPMQQPMMPMVMPGYSHMAPIPMQQVGYPGGFRVVPAPVPAPMNPSLPANTAWKSALAPGYQAAQAPAMTSPTRGSLSRW